LSYTTESATSKNPRNKKEDKISWVACVCSRQSISYVFNFVKGIFVIFTIIFMILGLSLALLIVFYQKISHKGHFFKAILIGLLYFAFIALLHGLLKLSNLLSFNIFLSTFVAAALPEEMGRYAIYRFWVTKQSNQLGQQAALLLFISLIFALIENILYIEKGALALVLRTFTAMPLHSLGALFILFYKRGLALSLIFHTFYNALALSLGFYSYFILIPLVAITLFIVIMRGIKLIHNNNKIDFFRK
jgi:drug/metabolite transporter superfamily protein YnfA